jgi:hypothetical protein
VTSTSASQSATLSSNGTGSLTITSIVASGDFALVTTATSCHYAGGTLAQGSTCTIDVVFTPTAAGTRNGSVTVTDNNGGVAGSTQTISLTGTGVAAPIASLSPGGLTFSALNVGTTSSGQTVTLSNTGTVALTISAISVTGDFAQTNNCAGSVAASSSCTFTVTFTPTAGNTRSGTLTVTDNTGGVAGSTQTASLTGTGIDFTFSYAGGAPSLPAVDVTPGQTASWTVALSSAGGFNQSVSLSCAGAPAGTTCTVNPTSVTPGNTFTISVPTVKPSTVAPHSQPLLPIPPLAGPVGLTLLVVLLTGLTWVTATRRHPGMRRLRAGLVLLAAGLLMTLAMAGCASTVTPPAFVPGTAAGQYNIVVTGTAGSLSHTVTVVMIVS